MLKLDPKPHPELLHIEPCAPPIDPDPLANVARLPL